MQRNSYVFSAGLHAGIVLFAVFGLPFYEPERPAEPPVILAELAPIAEQSNVPKVQPRPVEAKAEPKPDPEPPKPEVKPEPPKPAPAAAAPPPPPPPPAPEPPKPVEAAKPAPAPEPLPAPKPLPKVEKTEAPPAPPKPVEKPAPPKPQPQVQTQAPQQPKTTNFTDVAALVNRLQKTPPAPTPSQPAPQVASRAPPAPAPRAEGPSNPNLPLSISEKDFIASQIYDKWNLDCGRRDAREHVVRIQFMLNPDGTLKTQPEVLDAVKLYTQENYRASAEAARRAVHKAVPFKFPPNTDVGKFTQEIVLNFDPRQQCNS
ncbi:hypothetical protein [Ferrovibrio sp.]|uniref:hypothetical protein n=1 Tax=Ferrovibrio sp. TaxID=1917215 RepID=UPI0025B9F5E6|nr:hypothetical protein [Ferrovibrio sp.]MBX3452993.1 hypothetical protein [Ferrovibrio sp.]